MEERLVTDFITEEGTHWWHIAKRALINQFIDGRNLKILVAGLGGGLICGELRRAGRHRVIGVDISPAACGYVNAKVGVPVVNGNLDNPLMFKAASFDLVIAADVLEHLDNDRQFLEEVRRCLKSPGAVIVTVPAYMHLWSSWDMRLNHKRRYSLSALKEKAGAAGFRIRKISYFHALLYPPAYVYRKILRLSGGRSSQRSEFAVLANRPAGRFFALYYALERLWLKYLNLPFGLSILGVLEKRD